MFVRLFSIVFGSLLGTLIILSVINEYGLEVEDAMRYTIMVLGGVSILSLVITVCFTCFVKAFGYDETTPKEKSHIFCFPEDSLKPNSILSYENSYKSSTPPPFTSINIPSVILNPNYLTSSQTTK